MHICPHTIRVIEDWAGKKINPKNGGHFFDESKSRRNASTLQGDSKDAVDDGHEELVKTSKKRKNGTCLTPDPEGEKEKREIGTPAEGERAATTEMRGQRRNIRDVMRGTLPTNKQPLFCRVLENETPQAIEFNDPHSPLATMSPAVLP